MIYKEWVHYLETRSPMPLIKPGLEKTRNAISEAGLFSLIDPKKVILVAGTNGKGTTTKTLEGLLLAAGQSVGIYTSPHLVDTRERIRFQGEDISENDFIFLCQKYKSLIEKWDLTHFEALTLFATDYFFNKNKTDWAIFEVGLGGTWDATNVIPHTTSLITSLGFDHMHILGNTLKEIAENKFGIIQNNNRVIHLQFDPCLDELYLNRLKSTQSKDLPVPEATFSIQKGSPLPQYILETKWGSTPISLSGKRAAQNMFLALYAFHALGFDPQKYLSTLAKIHWPARMTELKTFAPCPVFLSGDHNLQGIESLCEILKNCSFEKLHLILGVSKNRSPKDYLPTLQEIKNISITLTKPSFQGVVPENIDNLAFFPDPLEALNAVKTQAKPQDLIVITGSLYLCGDYLKEASSQPSGILQSI